MNEHLVFLPVQTDIAILPNPGAPHYGYHIWHPGKPCSSDRLITA